MRGLLAKFLDAAARRRVLGHPGVRVAKSAKVRFGGIALKPGCALSIGECSIVEASLFYDREGATISIGARTFIGGSMLVSAERIQFGDDVLMAWGGTIVDHDSHSLDWKERRDTVTAWHEGRKDWTHVPRAPIRICDKAWIGFNVSILKGVTVGEGAVVAACSVVTHDVEPYTLVGGNPIRFIRRLSPS